jgi:hypothetical protein
MAARGDTRLNSTDYTHPQERHLLDLHYAMQYRNDGTPEIRVNSTFDGNVVITGNVNIPGNVQVFSDPNNPVHTHVTEIGTSGILNVPWMPIAGNVTLDAGTNSIGNVRITDMPGVYVTNFPSNIRITDMPGITGNVWVNGITGNIEAITRLPAITGNVGVSGNVEISRMPGVTGNVHVYGGNVQVTQGTTPWVTTGNANVIVTGNVAGITTLPAITGNVGVSGNVEVTRMPAVTGNVQIWDGGNSITVDGNVTATITGNSTFTLGTGSTDAFGRLRVSEPYTLFDSRARYYDHNEFSNVNTTGGTVVYDANSSTYQLNVTAANGSSVIRETKRVFPYQPGKSLLVLSTFCMNTPKANLRQRVGYFTTNNGIYFENDGTYNYLVIRSYSSGALVEDRVRQDAWDNPFLALQVDRTQIFWTDIEWLGVGSVRCGFVVNGAYVLCHTFHHANVAGNTTTYMTTATLPVRYEITNTAGTTGASMMRQICSTVISEGGYNAFTYSETAGRGTSVLRLSSSGTYYPVVSIRLDSTRLDAIVLPRQVDVLSPTVNYYRWKLVLNPTLTNANWAGHSSTGTVEYDTAATAISGGIELQAGYVSSRELSELGADAFAFQLGRTLAGVSDIVTLAMAATSNNADVLAQIGWQEIT